MSKRVEKGSAAVQQNLFNFDGPAFKNSRHVLTSPRSLRACASLGIKPVDLLPKSVELFQQDLAWSGLTRSQMLALHREREARRCAKLRKAQEEYRRLLALAGEGSGRGQPRGGADSSHHPTVSSRRGQNSRGQGKAARRRAKSASSCNDHMGLSKDERILRALLSRLQAKELQEHTAVTAHQRWLKEREERAGLKEAEAKRHKAEVFLKRQQDRMKMEKVHQTKLCHEELATESRKVDVGASWHRWEEGARLQAQLKEQALSARKTKERQRKTAQKRRHSCTAALEDKARQQVKCRLEQTMEEAARVRSAKETQSVIVQQVRNATERALFEARRREVEEERRVETALLQKAIELKDRAASQRQTLAAAAREGRQIQSRKERAVREQQAKLQQLGEAEEEWRKTTEEQGRETMAHAEMLAAQHTNLKRTKAREMRAMWANEHAANLARVQSEEEAKLALVKEELEVKARKSEELLSNKENSIRQTQSQAQVMAQLRTQLKDKISQRSFDQMAREADMRAALENKCSASRPTPKVIIA